MTQDQQKVQKVLQSLRKSVKEELEKKKRLGQYAVVWRDNKIAYLYKEEDDKIQNENKEAGR